MFSIFLAIVGGKPKDGLDAEEDVGRVAGVGMDGGVGEAGDGDLHLGGAAHRKHGEIEGATVDPGPARDDDVEPGGPSHGIHQPRLPVPKRSHWVVSAILALVMAPSATRGVATPRGRAPARVARVRPRHRHHGRASRRRQIGRYRAQRCRLPRPPRRPYRGWRGPYPSRLADAADAQTPNRNNRGKSRPTKPAKAYPLGSGASIC